MKQKIILISIVILFFSLGFISYNLWSAVDYLNNKVVINGIKLTDIKDGSYPGEFSAGFLSAKVRVTVKNRQITGIEILKHNNLRGQVAEGIIDEVIAKQSLQVDLINGATLSSKLILKALENSLK